MVKTTRAQREAIYRVFNRGPVFPYLTNTEKAEGITAFALTYRQFRRTVVHGDFGSVVVPWCGMWLCIENDGHVHS